MGSLFVTRFNADVTVLLRPLYNFWKQQRCHVHSGLWWLFCKAFQVQCTIILHVPHLCLHDQSFKMEQLCRHALFLHPSWRAKPASWGVLRLFWITCCIYIIYIYIYIYICLCAPQCLSTRCIGNTRIGDPLATGIQAPAGTCKLMNIAIQTNCIKYQMLHVFLT